VPGGNTSLRDFRMRLRSRRGFALWDFIDGVLGDGWHLLEFGRAYPSCFSADFRISAELLRRCVDGVLKWDWCLISQQAYSRRRCLGRFLFDPSRTSKSLWLLQPLTDQTNKRYEKSLYKSCQFSSKNRIQC
jgi:hypothetical protein